MRCWGLWSRTYYIMIPESRCFEIDRYYYYYSYSSKLKMSNLIVNTTLKQLAQYFSSLIVDAPIDHLSTLRTQSSSSTPRKPALINPNCVSNGLMPTLPDQSRLWYLPIWDLGQKSGQRRSGSKFVKRDLLRNQLVMEEPRCHRVGKR